MSAVDHLKSPFVDNWDAYTGKCGIVSLNVTIPSLGVVSAEFVKSVEEGEAKLAVKCSSCFKSG